METTKVIYQIDTAPEPREAPTIAAARLRCRRWLADEPGATRGRVAVVRRGYPEVISEYRRTESARGDVLIVRKGVWS